LLLIISLGCVLFVFIWCCMHEWATVRLGKKRRAVWNSVLNWGHCKTAV
jgi:hypothetical protein